MKKDKTNKDLIETNIVFEMIKTLGYKQQDS